METKKCSKCNIKKSISQFYKNKSHKDGLYRQCKQCVKKYRIKYHQKPEIKEKTIKYQAEYFQRKRKAYRKNPEEMKKRNDYAKEYNQWPEVREKRIRYRTKYYQKNKERIKEKRKRYYKKYYSQPEAKRRRKKYYQNNKERIRKKARTYQKQPHVIQKRRDYMNNYLKIKRQANPTFRLNNSIKTAIYISLKGNKKGRHWEDLVGYSLKELKIHLEKQFDDKMNWNNYGSYWWIDHIKAISLFNFIHPEDKEFKECWALSNLQPLEKIENIKKSNKYKENSNPIPLSI